MNQLKLVNQETTDTVNQVRPIDGVSEKYGFVSTRNILDKMEQHGWIVESVQKNKARKNIGYERHCVWLRNPSLENMDGLSEDNKSKLRLCLVNSHDMTSAVKIYFGILRIACENQLVAGNLFRYFSAPHTKSIISKLDIGLSYMTEGIPELLNTIKTLQDTKLDQDVIQSFSKEIIDYRFRNVNNILSINYDIINRPMRKEDKEQDAFTVLNRIQEYVIRGGIDFTYEKEVDGIRIIKNGTTRKLNSISSQIEMNQVLTNGILKLVA